MIRWIRPSLGTAAWRVGVREPDILLVDVRDLIDGEGNGAATLAPKIESALAGLKADRRVVICCDHGISRSNAVAVGVLARWESRPFFEALSQVTQAVRESEIKIEVLREIRDLVEPAPPSRTDSTARRILLTGGSGHLGRAVQPELRSVGTVLAPMRRELDLLSGPTSLELYVHTHGITDIVHLAAPRIQNVNSAVGESISMLRSIANVCSENGLFLIFPSSIDLFGGYRCESLLADETLPYKPKGHRGESKYLSELLLLHYRNHYNLACSILRIATTYGGRDPKPYFLNSFIQKALTHEDIATHRFENGLPKLDLIHIDDVAVGIAKVLNAREPEVFHLGSGRAIATAAIADRIIEWLQSSSRRSEISVSDFTSNLVMDTSKAQNRLDWRPRIQPLEGLQEYVAQLPSVLPTTDRSRTP